MAAPTDLEQLSHNRGQLRPAPAASIWRIDVALGRPVDINRAYASWSEQMVYYLAYQNYLNGGPWAPLALHPDESWHCKGMAVDSDESPRTVPSLAPLWSDNGWRFEVKTERWHGQYYTSLDKNYGKPAGDGSIPFPTPGVPASPIIEGAEDMRFLYVEDSVDGNGIPGWALLNVNTGKVTVLRNDGTSIQQERANSWARVWGPALKCKRQDMLNAMAAINGTK